MKPRVKINGKSSRDDNEYDYGDTGVVDGYCQGAYSVPYAVVILDKNFRFVMVKLEQLEQIGVKEVPEYYQHFDPDC